MWGDITPELYYIHPMCSFRIKRNVLGKPFPLPCLQKLDNTKSNSIHKVSMNVLKYLDRRLQRVRKLLLETSITQEIVMQRLCLERSESGEKRNFRNILTYCF